MAEHEVPAGAIAVSKDGEIVAEAGIGREAATPAPVASLSKAITAVCTLMLLEETGTDRAATLRETLSPDLFVPPPADPSLRDVTIGSLLNHTSGISDGLFGYHVGALPRFSREDKEGQFAQLATRPLKAVGRYEYANLNYLALGLVIEALSGDDYETYCQRKVLAPLGISARLLDKWRVLTAYGGWSISARDYLIFANAHLGDGKGGPGVWVADTTLDAEAGRGAIYGPGVLIRRTEGGTTIWHAGAWEWRGKRRQASFGAYFALYDNGIGVAVNHDRSALGAPLSALDTGLWRAANGR